MTLGGLYLPVSRDAISLTVSAPVLQHLHQVGCAENRRTVSPERSPTFRSLVRAMATDVDHGYDIGAKNLCDRDLEEDRADA